jgi:hypothetical protein
MAETSAGRRAEMLAVCLAMQWAVLKGPVSVERSDEHTAALLAVPWVFETVFLTVVMTAYKSAAMWVPAMWLAGMLAHPEAG